MAEAISVSDVRIQENPLKNVKIDLAQNVVFGALPSLKRIALIKIAISLWQGEAGRQEILKALSDDNPNRLLYQERLVKFGKGVVNKITSLVLPEACKQQLKDTVFEISEEILKFFASHQHLENFSSSNVQIYADNIVWTSQGTINHAKSAASLLTNTDFDTKEKYIIACNNCMEGSIRDLVHHFPADFIDPKWPALVLFWTLYIRGRVEEFCEMACPERRRITNYELVFEYAVKFECEGAVQYIWEHFPNEKIRKNLVKFARTAASWSSSPSAVTYLFGQMDQKQITELCDSSDILLNTLLKDWRFHGLFVPTAKYALQFILNIKFLSASNFIQLCWKEKVLEPSDYKNILKQFVLHFKSEIKKKFAENCKYFLSFLFFVEDAETLKIFLNIGTLQERKEFIYNDFVMDLCSDLVMKGKLDFLDVFIKAMFHSKKDLYLFERELFSSRCYEITFDLIVADMYELLEKFLIMFRTEKGKGMWSYKQELIEDEGEQLMATIIEKIGYKNGEQLEAMDKYLNWVFEGDNKAILKYKAMVLDPEIPIQTATKYNTCKSKFLQQVCKLIEIKEWKLANRYLDWACWVGDSLDAKLKLKHSICLGYYMVFEFKLGIDYRASFKAFVGSFLSQDEIDVLDNALRESFETSSRKTAWELSDALSTMTLPTEVCSHPIPNDSKGEKEEKEKKKKKKKKNFFWKKFM